MNPLWIFFLLIGLVVLIPNAHADTIIQNLDGGMDIEITYPDEIIVGREGVISILVKNNGWEDKQDISFMFSSQDNALSLGESSRIIIFKLAQGGSYGGNIDFLVPNNANPGIYFLNLSYSQILVANNEVRMPEIFHDIAICITIKDTFSKIETKTVKITFQIITPN